jgi:hypothetical protein
MGNINKIIIVGGGSAGWMTASTLIKAYPEKEIILIESPNVPTVGVGESTVGGIKFWSKFLGIDDKEFMSATDASYKLSIKFTDFYKKGEAFHYPFGVPTSDHPNDWWFKKIHKPETEYSDYADCMYPQMALVNQNKLGYNENSDIPFNFHKDVAFHFDATKFGSWLKDNYCIPRGVKHIKEEIISIEQDDNGISLLNGKYTADLYVDCTGFKSLLLGETLKEPFENFDDILPNNSAWATHIPYKNKERELVSYTNCTAIENGWVWNIPLWSHIGTGYVYSNKFTTDEEALQQFKNHLNTNTDDLEFKKIKMKTGSHKRLWVKNVVSIGLSAGFIEPLESNGLYTTHEFLMKLVYTLRKGCISQWDRDSYTFMCKELFQQFVEFVAMHYALSQRDDTEYWRSNLNKTWCPDLLNFNKTALYDMKSYAIDINNHVNNLVGGHHCIGAGMHNAPTSVYPLMFYQQKTEKEIVEGCKAITEKIDRRKEEWNQSISHYDSLYEFLKKHIHTTGE